MMRFCLLLFVSLGLLTLSVSAKRTPLNPDYVMDFPGTLTVRTYLGEKISPFRIVDDTRDQNLQYRPNGILSLGVGVTIKGIGLNFSTRLPFHDYKEDLYGRTRRLDVQVHRYRGNLALDIYAQRYRGYHLNDKSAVTAISAPPEYPFYPNLQQITIGGAFMHVFNGDKYSLRAMVNQQEWQLRSAGSPMLGGAVFTHFLSNGDSALIPTNLRFRDFLDSSSIKKINAYGISANGGYGYNLVIKKHWFISASGDVGAGVSFTETKEMSGKETDKFGLFLNTNARFGAGYNSIKWFAGFYTIYRTDILPLPFEDARLRMSEGLFRVVVARRLRTGRLPASPN